MVKTAVLVSGNGERLQTLLDARLLGELGSCELTAVISSSPEAYALVRARNASIPVYIVDEEVFPNRATFCEAVLAKLRDLDIELAVLADFSHILDSRIIKYYKNRVICVHPSLLPAFCGRGVYGLRVHELALSSGVKVTGATAYFATEEVGEGPIIAQKAVEVMPDDTPESLRVRVLEKAEWAVLPLSVSLYCQGRLKVSDGVVTIAPEGDKRPEPVAAQTSGAVLP